MRKFFAFILPWHLHVWGKWVDTESGKITRTLPDGGKLYIGSYIEQKRTCVLCNKAQLNCQSVYGAEDNE